MLANLTNLTNLYKLYNLIKKVYVFLSLLTVYDCARSGAISKFSSTFNSPLNTNPTTLAEEESVNNIGFKFDGFAPRLSRKVLEGGFVGGEEQEIV